MSNEAGFNGEDLATMLTYVCWRATRTLFIERLISVMDLEMVSSKAGFHSKGLTTLLTHIWPVLKRASAITRTLFTTRLVSTMELEVTSEAGLHGETFATLLAAVWLYLLEVLV